MFAHQINLVWWTYSAPLEKVDYEALNDDPDTMGNVVASKTNSDNKLNVRPSLRARITFQQNVRDSNLLYSMETWLSPVVLHKAVTPESFTVYHLDRAAASHKATGGGFCLRVIVSLSVAMLGV